MKPLRLAFPVYLMVMVTMSTWVQAETQRVEVLGVGEQVIEARAGGEILRLVTPSKKHWLIRGLAKGDRVTVDYRQDGEQKVISAVQGHGVVIGTVVKVEKVFITVETAEGVRHRLMPRWIGGMPKNGGGHDKAVLEQIHAVSPGQRVKLTWVIEEGKRVTGVEPHGNG